MAILNILHYPDSRLRIVAKPVVIFNTGLRKTIEDMTETMYFSSGIGLAATQVNVHEQIFIVDISHNQNSLYIFINPSIIKSSFEKQIQNEGCLSIPGIYDKVKRFAQIQVQAYNVHGQMFKIEAEGLFAACIQHEIDHLYGKLFIEHLSQLKFSRFITKLKKEKRMHRLDNNHFFQK